MIALQRRLRETFLPPFLFPAGYETNDVMPDVRRCSQLNPEAPFCEAASPKGLSLLRRCHEAEALLEHAVIP